MAGAGGPRRSPAPLGPRGWKGSIPASWSVLVPRSRAAQTPEVSSLLRKEVKRFSQGHTDLPKDTQKACGKAGNPRWVPAPSAHGLFAAFKQIKSQLRAGPLLFWVLREQKACPCARAIS